jgi:hypothetical protein
VTVDGLELIGSAGGTNKPGVSCSQTGGTATLRVVNSSIHNSGQAGVSSSDCTLVLDANVIGPSNTGGGVVLSGNTIYTLTNNIIHSNGTGVPGVDISTGSSGVFAFNTVANNGGAAPGSAGGVTCAAGATNALQNSIVVLNQLTAVGGTQFSGNCTLSNVVTGPDTFTGANMSVPDLDSTYRLKLNTANRDCCINKLPSPAPAIENQSHDVDREARPKGAGTMPYDIGADEAE